MSKLIKKLLNTGFFHIFGSSVINRIITFLTSIVLVRILSKIEYGKFTYTWNIYNIFLIFSGMSIESGVLQLISEHNHDIEYADRITNYGVRFGVKFNLYLCGIILGTALFIPLPIVGAKEILCLLSFLPMVHFLFQMIIVYLRAQKRNREFASLNTINTLLVFAATVILSLLMKIQGLVAGYYVAYVASYLIGIFIYRIKLFNETPAIEKSVKNVLLKISMITMLNNGLSQLMYLLDVFIIGVVDPQETILASYKVATMLPSALVFIPISLVTYLYPYFAENRKDGSWCLKRYKQVVIWLGSFNLVLSSILFIGAPFIIRILFGNQYSDSVPIFRILSISYFFSGTFRILSGNLLVTQRKLKFNLLVAAISSLINIIADYFFILWWGAMGAAFASSLVVVFTSVVNTLYLIHTFKSNSLDRNIHHCLE